MNSNLAPIHVMALLDKQLDVITLLLNRDRAAAEGTDQSAIEADPSKERNRVQDKIRDIKSRVLEAAKAPASHPAPPPPEGPCPA